MQEGDELVFFIAMVYAAVMMMPIMRIPTDLDPPFPDSFCILS
jgi:hypothetical protein